MDVQGWEERTRVEGVRGRENGVAVKGGGAAARGRWDVEDGAA